LAAAVLGLTILGCEQKQEPVPAAAPAAPSTPSAAAPAAPSTPSAPATPAPAASESGTAASATPAIPAAPTVPAVPADAAASAAAKEAPAAATTQPVDSATSAKAQELLDQAMQYIKDNKYDLADKTLTQLEGMKASLSPTMQKSVDQARTMLTTAKAGGGIKLPSLGGESK